MKTFGLIAAAAVLALVLGAGASLGTRPADAAVEDTVAVGCEFLGDAIDGADDGVADFTAACNGLSSADLANLADALGDEDGVLEAEDFADVDLDANQLQDDGAAPANSIYIIAFVDDDEVVTFDAEAGVTVAVNVDTTGAPSADADANAETCAGVDDLDCDTAIDDDGDGVVVATITEGSAEDDDEIDVDVFQADDASSVETETLVVQGAADEVTAVAAEETIGVSADVDACQDESDVGDATDQLADIEKTVVIATVVDSDGDDLARIPLVWEADGSVFIDDDTDDTDADAATGVTVDAGAAGIGGFAVVCGDEDPGDGTVTVTINAETAGEESDTVDIAVVGEPATVAATAAPSPINCDGTTTSTVTATVTDADGNPVADGTNVNFSVVALGTANPINATTTAGVATSTITPLSAATAGVTVIVSAGDAQASVLVQCNPAAAPTATPGGPGAVPTPTTRPGGTVRPPDTGNGGYLGQDSSAGFPLWTLFALGLGSVALIAGGAAVRKVSK